MINFNNLKKKGIAFDSSEIKRLLIKCQRSSKESVVVNSKLKLFLLLSEVTIKQVNNFFFLVRNYNAVFHTKDDIVNECYLILDHCVKGFNLFSNNSFLWYYNKGLTWGMMRLVEKNYLKYSNVDNVKQDWESFVFKQTEQNNYDFVNYYMDVCDLTKEEKQIVNSRLNKEKVDVFLDNNHNLSKGQYFQKLKTIKEKFKILQDG